MPIARLKLLWKAPWATWQQILLCWCCQAHLKCATYQWVLFSQGSSTHCYLEIHTELHQATFSHDQTPPHSSFLIKPSPISMLHLWLWMAHCASAADAVCAELQTSSGMLNLTKCQTLVWRKTVCIAMSSCSWLQAWSICVVSWHSVSCIWLMIRNYRPLRVTCRSAQPSPWERISRKCNTRSADASSLRGTCYRTETCVRRYMLFFACCTCLLCISRSACICKSYVTALLIRHQALGSTMCLPLLLHSRRSTKAKKMCPLLNSIATWSTWIVALSTIPLHAK